MEGFQWLRGLGWSPDTNVPLLGCRGRGGCWRVRGDYWLAGRFEARIFAGLVGRCFGSGSLFAGRLLVFHRIPAPGGEYAVEVFGEAARLGVLEYLPRRGWVLYPSGALGSILLTSGVPAVELRGVRGRLKGKRLRLEASVAGECLLLLPDCGHVAVASRTASGAVKVRDVAPRGFRLLRRAGLEEVLEANSEQVGGLAAEAREFIRRVYARVMASRGRVYVALSGGADSAAVLSLAREALGSERVAAVYADTGMEFPEAKRQAERLASMLGVDLEVVEPDVDPLEEIARRGLMSRGNRWCTRLLKLEPLKRFYERVGARLVLDGARAWESENRAATPRLGENPLVPGVKRALPIHHWPRLAVQLYLAERSIPVNTLYLEGLTRIGCIACPAMHLYELHVAYRLHPWWFHRLARRLAEAKGTDPREELARLLRGEWRREKTTVGGTAGNS